jgi:hypothetical protein
MMEAIIALGREVQIAIGPEIIRPQNKAVNSRIEVITG